MSNYPDDVDANHVNFNNDGPECKLCFAPITDENPSKDMPEYVFICYRNKASNIPSEYHNLLKGYSSEGCAECVGEAVKTIALQWVAADALEDAAGLIAEHLGLDLPRKSLVAA